MRRTKKYRSPLGGCGMYRKNMRFFFGYREACPRIRYEHGFPLSGEWVGSSAFPRQTAKSKQFNEPGL